MNNYILRQDDQTLHFFHIPNQGLALRKKYINLWHNHRIILPDSNGIFSVTKSDKDAINIVSLTAKNEIMYIILNKNGEKHYLLTTLNEKMSVRNIFIFRTPIGLNILYTAKYLGKLLLVHCILGDNARPDTIDEIQNSDFFVYKSSVYYTNSKGILGYKILSDGKADIFNSITANAFSPHLYSFRNIDYITYIMDNKIYFQNRPIADDPDAKNPIIIEESGELYIMWQKGDFIRYVSSMGSDADFPPIMQYVSSGKIPTTIGVIRDNQVHRYFATLSPNEMHIFGKSDPFCSVGCTEQNINPQPLTGFKLLLDMEKNYSKNKRNSTSFRDNK